MAWLVSASAQPTITVHPQSQDLCWSVTGNEYVTLSLTATSSGGPLTYQWYKDGTEHPGATGTSVQLYSVHVTGAPSWTCRVWDNNGNTLSNGAVVTPILKPMKPNSITVLPGSVCPGNNITLQPEGNASVEYDWYYYSGSCGGTLLGSGQGNHVTQLNSTTTYYVRGENTCGVSICESVTVPILSSSSPASSISATKSSICNGEQTSLSVVGGSLGANATWRWYSGSCGGTLFGSGISINASPASTTTYFVRAEGSCNTTSCNEVTITVKPVPGKPAASGSEVCEGDDASLNATGTSLVWYDDVGLSNQVGTGSPFNPGITEAGTYTYYVTQTAAGCEGPAETVILEVNPVPQTAVLGDPEFCDYESQEYHLGSTSEPGNSYSWTSDPPGFSSSDPDPVVSPDSNITFHLTQTIDSSGCQSTDTVTFTVHPSPELEATPAETYLQKGGQQELTASGADSYAWDPEGGLNTTTGGSVTAYPEENTAYVVTGTSIHGCKTTDTIYVYVYCEACTDTILLNSSGHFSHGCTNNDYTNNAACSWTLYPSGVSKIYLQMNPDSFDVREGDWLRVYNGPDEDSPLLGEYNNANPPAGIIEGGSIMFIQFTSDESGTGKGFQAGYANEPAISVPELRQDLYSVFPNPNRGRIRIAFARPPEKTELMLFNSLGRMILHKKIDGQQEILVLDLSHLPQGIYYLHLADPPDPGRIIIRQ